jgi:hypothetical protein
MDLIMTILGIIAMILVIGCVVAGVVEVFFPGDDRYWEK